MAGIKNSTIRDIDMTAKAPVAGSEVNAILRFVRELIPGNDAEAGDRQLSALAIALCVGARDCGAHPETFQKIVNDYYEDVLTRELVPLDKTPI